MSDVTAKECPTCGGSGMVARYYGIDGCADCLATGRVLSDGASIRVSVTRLTADVERLRQRLTERDAEVVTLTEQRDRARYELRRTSATWQCVVCNARDEYDFDLASGYWSCMACQAEFELEEGPRGRIKSAVRRGLTDSDFSGLGN